MSNIHTLHFNNSDDARIAISDLLKKGYTNPQVTVSYEFDGMDFLNHGDPNSCVLKVLLNKPIYVKKINTHYRDEVEKYEDCSNVALPAVRSSNNAPRYTSVRPSNNATRYASVRPSNNATRYASVLPIYVDVLKVPHHQGRFLGYCIGINKKNNKIKGVLHRQEGHMNAAYTPVYQIDWDRHMQNWTSPGKCSRC